MANERASAGKIAPRRCAYPLGCGADRCDHPKRRARVQRVELAREWLNHLGGLASLLNADFHRLSGLRGLGKAVYCKLKAAAELQRRYLRQSLERKGQLGCTQDAQQLLYAQLRHHESEVFACLFLDNRHRIIQFEKL